ncbi:MAG TPA: filamentous hemagglutinin N-terminal domain-containing protein, partial [Pseudomonadales bacterium]|nr:filamentous hemagglutinin N-terminal domain-containing protein [Pseudomonadales bacterium]
MRTTLSKKKLVLEMQRAMYSASSVRVPVLAISLLSGGVLLISADNASAADYRLPDLNHATNAKIVPTAQAGRMNIRQSAPKAILDWNSFNVGRDSKVVFDQPDSAAVALNRISASSGKASEILGSVTANGQIYLINPNGFVFGKDSQVNASSVLVSTLNMDEGLFNNEGLAGAQKANSTNYQDRNFAALNGTPVIDAAGKPVAIKVEKGAKVKAGESGRVMMFAPTVQNSGEIAAGEGGQVILGASQDKVYLTNSTDPNLAGYLVEVNTGGTVTNEGKVFADQGNVTLAGAAINQKGIVRATSTVNLHGSVILKAQDNLDVSAPSAGASSDVAATVVAKSGGKLDLASGSRTEVINAYADSEDYSLDQLEKFVNQAQVYNKPEKPRKDVQLKGKQIHLEKGSLVKATGGNVSIEASAVPKPTELDELTKDDPRLNLDQSVRVQIDAGATIDVSGAEANLEMARNLVNVQLYSNELKDAPVQRNGALKGETITVDTRKYTAKGNRGTDFADISAAIENIKTTQAEQTSKGGTISISALGGDVITQKGSLLNVSGGKLNFAGGMVSTTKLLQHGKLIDIFDADPNQVYDGIAGVETRTSKKWGTSRSYGNSSATPFGYYEAGYTQGQDAGSVSISGGGLALDGDMKADVVNGVYQREQANNKNGKIYVDRANGGQFQIGLSDSINRSDDMKGYVGTPAIELTEEQKDRQRTIALTDNLLDDEVKTLSLSVDKLREQGFSRFNFNSDSSISVAASTKTLDLGAGGEFKVNAPKIVIARSIKGEGATIAAATTMNKPLNVKLLEDPSL